MVWNHGGNILICILATVPAWFFGGVESGFQVWLFAPALIAILCWMAVEVAGQKPVVLPLAIIPLTLGIIWGGFQLVPLAPEARATLSPNGEKWRVPTEISPHALTDTSSASSAWGPLSLYPASTRRDVSLLILAGSVFLAAAGLVRTRSAFFWLTGVVACNGALLTFFGLVQKLSWNGLLFWQVPLSQGGAPFASFVNRNNAAGYLNLCLAAAIGMGSFILLQQQVELPEEHTPASRGRRHWITRVGNAWNRFLRTLSPGGMVAAACAALLVAGILTSLSRGGILSMVAGGTGLLLMAIFLRHAYVARIALGGIAGVLLIAWIGTTQSIKQRLATLFQTEVITNGRVDHWKDSLAVAADFLPTGTGLGVYRYIYKPYEARASDSWFYHAENQYLEGLVEAGVVGLALILGSLLLVTIAAGMLTTESHQWRSWAAGGTVVFAIISQAVHALFDFGLYLPANFLLLAILSGAACGIAARRFPDSLFIRIPLKTSSPVAPIVLAAIFVGGLVWGAKETWATAGVEAAIEDSRWEGVDHDISQEQLMASIDRLEAALIYRPDDVAGQFRLSKLYTQLYRVRAMQRLIDRTGQPAASLTDAQRIAVWDLTSPIVFYSQALRAPTVPGGNDQIQQWRESALIQKTLKPARNHLYLARHACPLLAEVELDLAVLQAALVDVSLAEQHLVRATMLASTNPEILYRCGAILLEAGNRELAAKCWQKSIAIAPHNLKKVLAVSHQRYTMDEIARQVLPQDPLLLVEVVEENYRTDANKFSRTVLLKHVERLLDEQTMAADQRAYIQGVICELREDFPAAAKYLTEAVDLQPSNFSWRFRLASAWLKAGDLEKAHQEARKCIRMDSGHKATLAMLRTIYQRQRAEMLPAEPAEPNVDKPFASGIRG